MKKVKWSEEEIKWACSHTLACEHTKFGLLVPGFARFSEGFYPNEKYHWILSECWRSAGFEAEVKKVLSRDGGSAYEYMNYPHPSTLTFSEYQKLWKEMTGGVRQIR